MEMKQVYTLTNDIASEILGRENVLNEDLQNVVDVGTEIMNNGSFDHFVKSLVDHIGKMVFVNRPYAGNAPSVLMDGWEYGAVLQKVSCDDYTAESNETWELEDRASYDTNIFYQPKVSSKFFNKRVTFEIPRSITYMQAKSGFDNGGQLGAFVSMLDTAVNNGMTIRVDGLIQRTINNMVGETFYDAMPSGTYTGAGNTRCINLLKRYNDTYNKSLTADACFYDADFIRYCVYIMTLTKKRLSKISGLFNIGGKTRFTPADRLHFITLSDFDAATVAFMQADTYHDELVRMPASESVPFWQGSGETYAVSDVSSIKITTASGHTVNPSGIIGVMFDRDALGVTNFERRTTNNWNPKAEFWSAWFKMESGYFNDTNENFIVFYAA